MSTILVVPVSVHEKALRGLRCIVSERTPVTLHHCHGGSMIDLFENPGMAQRACPYLQIPLHFDYHIGTFGIDSGTGTFRGVREWEAAFGKQADMLNEVSGLVGYCVIESARKWIHKNNPL